jgi:hypothetical protein
MDKHDKIIRQMQKIVLDDLPWIPVMYERSFFLHYPQLLNLRKASIIKNYVKYIKLENQI